MTTPTSTTQDHWVIIHGNPVDGLSIIGPFLSHAEAMTFANEDAHISDQWWIVQCERPTHG